MICPNCKKSIDGNSIFCEFCGKKIEIRSESVPTIEGVPCTGIQVIEHLEFLGYVIKDKEVNEDGTIRFILAIHKTAKPNILINFYSDIGFTVVSNFRLGELTKKVKRSELLEKINTINSRSLLCAYSLNAESDLVTVGAWYHGEYVKHYLSTFLDLYEKDISHRFEEADFS